MKDVNKKIVVSISLAPELLKLVNDTVSNRSKFLENCIISELCKSEDIKSELKKKFIIL
jgi:metal-responsive CopG/Arc/MetJ family transcriptional regulator